MSNEPSKPFPPASPVAGQSSVEPLTGIAACLFVVELAMVGAVAYGVLSAALHLL